MGNYEILYKAYEAAYAPVFLELTRRLQIGNGGKVNELVHSHVLADHTFKSVVAPNIDTVYSTVWVDLSEGPYVIHKPKLDRYVSFALLDAYTNAETIVGTGADGNEEADYLVTGPDYEGEIPSGYRHLQLSTYQAWGIIRTIIYSPEDIENVLKIQEQITYKPFEGTKPVAPEVFPNEVYKPIAKIGSLSLEEFFNIYNYVLIKNKDKYGNEADQKEWEKLGIGAGLKFDASGFSQEILNIPADYAKGFSSSGFGIDEINGWSYPDDALGLYKDNFKFRSSVAYFGLGANPVKMSTYPSTHVDNNGDQLDGKNNYKIHFESFPTVEQDGFWSITLYDNYERYLVENEIGRYGITDRDALVKNEDGSVDIYIQKERPSEDLVSNWLPSYDGEFNLIFRIYLPGKEVIERSWIIPAVEIQ